MESEGRRASNSSLHDEPSIIGKPIAILELGSFMETTVCEAAHLKFEGDVLSVREVDP